MPNSVTIHISPRERAVLCGYLVQNAKAKGPVEERALVAVFDEFGMTDLVSALDTTNVWTQDIARADVEVSNASLAFVISALNADTPKAPLQALILRPLADALAKAQAN